MAELHKVGHSFCGVHWPCKICFIGGVYQAYKAIISFQVNIKPTRLTISTFKAYQKVYKISQNHYRAVAHLTTW